MRTYKETGRQSRLRDYHHSLHTAAVERAQALAALHESGMTYADIARQYEVTETAIIQALKRQGLFKVGMHKHLCTPVNTVYLMHEYYRDNHSLRETAAHFGVALKTVHICFRRHGLFIRTRQHALILYNALDQETQAMYQDHKNGMTYEQIGEKYHYSLHTIYRRFSTRHLKGRVGGDRSIAK